MNTKNIRDIIELCKEFDIKLYPKNTNVSVYLKPTEETTNIKPVFYIKQSLTTQ
jgi:hypothetical protein